MAVPLINVNIVPVLDILDRQVVLAHGGERATYRPLESFLTKSTDPVDVAEAIRDEYGFSEIYCADLDAIDGRPPALSIYGALQQAGLSLWIDAGLRKAADAAPLKEAQVRRIIAGLETLASPAELAALVGSVGDALIFSLDLRDGRPIGNRAVWAGNTSDEAAPKQIALKAIEQGVRRMIVLDLARIGSRSGVATLDLCEKISLAHKRVELITGGGIKSSADLPALAAIGVHTALVGTALHQPGFFKG
jgi:phosphoribosylformimino-5-aminoimidazole carboxamide ribotide isomerase